MKARLYRMALTVSMLDTARPIPLLRYQTGDLVRLLDRPMSHNSCVITASRCRARFLMRCWCCVAGTKTGYPMGLMSRPTGTLSTWIARSPRA